MPSVPHADPADQCRRKPDRVREGDRLAEVMAPVGEEANDQVDRFARAKQQIPFGTGDDRTPEADWRRRSPRKARRSSFGTKANCYTCHEPHRLGRRLNRGDYDCSWSIGAEVRLDCHGVTALGNGRRKSDPLNDICNKDNREGLVVRGSGNRRVKDKPDLLKTRKSPRPDEQPVAHEFYAAIRNAHQPRNLRQGDLPRGSPSAGSFICRV